MIKWFLKYFNERGIKDVFRDVNCNINKIIVGPDVNRDFNIVFPERMKIGDGTVINGSCYINSFGNIEIGKYCHIAKGLTILTHNHNWRSNKLIPYDEIEISRSVIIGDAVWIGADVTISPGTSIGNGAIISIGSVVFGNIPDCAIIRGNPAVIIGYRDKEIFYKLYQEGKFY